jgi:protoporphyrinogen oxidase
VSGKHSHVVVLGAGPAGLTAGYLLAKKGIRVTVLEADAHYVGGIARTVCYKGFRFDIGGHRFFTRSAEVQRFWSEMLPDDMLECRRVSRIYYRNRFFSYPIKPVEALLKLGLAESIRCASSYIKARLSPISNPVTFEDWVTNKFGRRLFEVFFKNYTEKVWGVPCSKISADWAAQRIKGMSLSAVVLNAFNWKSRTRAKEIKSLVGFFSYPRRGPGMMWERCAERMRQLGGTLLMNRRAEELCYSSSSERWTILSKTSEGNVETVEATDVISSIPIVDLADMLKPNVSADALKAAHALRYRDFMTAALILKDRNNLKDHWLYVHDPSVRVGRIQNFKVWSPELVPDKSLRCLGLEYFCNSSEDLWEMADKDFVDFALNELISLGLARREDFLDGCVVRQLKAYPFYGSDDKDNVERFIAELDQTFPRLHLVGRNGRHRYNNQDHSMVTAMLAVENIIAGKRLYNLRSVNEDAEYHEEGSFGDWSGLRE